MLAVVFRQEPDTRVPTRIGLTGARVRTNCQGRLFLLLLPVIASAQLQGDWSGTLDTGEAFNLSLAEDTFTLVITAEVSEDVLTVTLETIVKGTWSTVEDSVSGENGLSLVPTSDPEVLIDGLDVETFIRKQFEDAGLDTPSDSTIAEIRNEFLGEGPDIGPVTFAYVLEGNALLLSTDNESIALSRSRVTAVITTSWGRIKSRN